MFRSRSYEIATREVAQPPVTSNNAQSIMLLIFGFPSMEVFETAQPHPVAKCALQKGIDA